MDEATLEGLICPPKVSQGLHCFAPSLPEADPGDTTRKAFEQPGLLGP